MSKQYYVYLTTNLINNKKYIGKHIGDINDNYLGSGVLLKRAIKKYGKENFKKDILCICNNEEELNNKECFYIKLYNAVNNPNYYNIADGGQGGNVSHGYSLEKRKEINQKISEKNSGKNHHMYGKHHSEETKQKLQIKSLQYWTDERKKERSKLYQGKNNPMYGKHQSQEAKNKINRDKRIKICQLDKNTLELIKEYDCIREAERQLNVSHGLIGRVLDKEDKTAYGYKWKTKI
jgi:group I intron endonuclease